MGHVADLRAFRSLSELPRADDIAKTTLATLDGLLGGLAFEETARRARERAEDIGLTRDDAKTSHGNAMDLLTRKPESSAERSLARAMAALALRGRSWSGADECERVAGEWLWLATRTPYNALGLVDHLFEDARSAELWAALAARVRASGEAKKDPAALPEAFVATLALLASPSKAAAGLVGDLTEAVTEPALAFALADSEPAAASASGELVSRPRGAVATVLLGVTGLVIVVEVYRLFARWVLAYRRPAEIVIQSGVVRVRSRTELLGRTIREHELTVSRENVAQATRDVRYPSLGLHVGLLALGLGSFFGVAILVDGLRLSAPSLVVSGLAVVTLGLAIDFVLSSVLPTRLGTCRVLIVPRRGAPIAVGRLQPAAADALLIRLRSP